MTKGIQRIADREKPASFRTEVYTITKRTMNKEHRNTVKNWRKNTELITNLISEISFLNTEIIIKVNNLVKVNSNELDELRLK